MKKISHDFGNNPRYLKLRKPLQAAEICDAARSLAHSRFDVISFKEGLLTLAVSSSSEAANLQFESQKLIDDINKKIGRNFVERLRFKIK